MTETCTSYNHVQGSPTEQTRRTWGHFQRANFSTVCSAKYTSSATPQTEEQEDWAYPQTEEEVLDLTCLICCFWTQQQSLSLPLSSVDPTRAAWWRARCHHQLQLGLQGLASQCSQFCFLPTSFWHQQWYWLDPCSHWWLLWPSHQQSRVGFCHFQQWWTSQTGSWSTPGVYEQHQDWVGSCQECLKGSQGCESPTYDYCCHGLHGHSLQDPVRIPSRWMVPPPWRSPNHQGDVSLCTRPLWSHLQWDRWHVRFELLQLLSTQLVSFWPKPDENKVMEISAHYIHPILGRKSPPHLSNLDHHSSAPGHDVPKQSTTNCSPATPPTPLFWCFWGCVLTARWSVQQHILSEPSFATAKQIFLDVWLVVASSPPGFRVNHSVCSEPLLKLLWREVHQHRDPSLQGRDHLRWLLTGQFACCWWTLIESRHFEVVILTPSQVE